MKSTFKLPVFAFLLVCFLFYSQAVASTLPLVKRAPDPPIPSVDDCKARLSVAKDKSVFYSSAVQKSAEAWATEHGGKTIWTAGLTDYQTDLRARIKAAEQKNGHVTWDYDRDGLTFFENCSKAFALVVSGEVTAILPAGSDGKPSKPKESLFTKIEWEVLKDPAQNPAVTKVTAIVGNTQGTLPTGDGEELCRDAKK